MTVAVKFEWFRDLTVSPGILNDGIVGCELEFVVPEGYSLQRIISGGGFQWARGYVGSSGQQDAYPCPYTSLYTISIDDGARPLYYAHYRYTLCDSGTSLIYFTNSFRFINIWGTFQNALHYDARNRFRAPAGGATIFFNWTALPIAAVDGATALHALPSNIVNGALQTQVLLSH